MCITKFLRIILITLLFLIYNLKNLQAIENKILFKIDNDIITTIDIYEEIKYRSPDYHLQNEDRAAKNVKLLEETYLEYSQNEL